jgi:hypothetical protein
VELLRKCFGRDVNFTINKMLIDDFYEINNRASPVPVYDFGFHANLIDAKGLSYFLDLARAIPDAVFFIPTPAIKILPMLVNLEAISSTWATGLELRLRQCKIVLCPSLWTAPVEAAVIKTMLLRKVVGLVKAPFSFANQLPDVCYIELTGNCDKDSVLLIAHLKNPGNLEQIASNGYEWASEYINNDA